jgi:hypothetical protein
MFALLLLVMAGCAAVKRSSATVDEGVIRNPSLGFFGFSFNIPDGFDLYDPAAAVQEDTPALQQLAIRVYEVNASYHPSENETFYESFLMLSDHTAFLLVTLTHDRLMSSNTEWAGDGIAIQRPLLPMYNAGKPEQVMIGENRLPSLMFSGRAYERKGWYYADPKAGRTGFSYQACRVEGGNRARYVLMGFCLPEHRHILSIQMQDMLHGFRH